MHLISVLLPLTDNAGAPHPPRLYTEVADALTTRFGGLTAFTRAPAQGLWQPDGARPPSRDDVVIFEVMAEHLDRDWWRGYRRTLERQFEQEQIVIRAHPIELL